jgi:formate dehydrogenase subunit gamma
MKRRNAITCPSRAALSAGRLPLPLPMPTPPAMPMPMPMPLPMRMPMPMLALLLAVAVLLASSPVSGAVPHEDAAPAYAEEQTILQIEKDRPEPGWGDAAPGRQHFDRHFIVPPGRMPAQDVILQRGGNTWRLLRNGPLALLSGTLLIGVPLVLLALWQFIGPAQTPAPTGRDLPRFSNYQRHLHWTTAITFVVLALSGLVMLFGKQIILPWLGHDLFSWLAVGSKYAHNFVGPAFIVCSLLMFLAFLKKNFFHGRDWNWLKRLGGLRGHAPAGFFNAGEKLWFWFGLGALGLLMSVTGLILNFPYWGEVGAVSGSTRYVQQSANILHLLGATFYIAAAMGHTYLGTAGTPGTYRGMRHGTVDEAWARKHHEAWYADVVASPGGAAGDGLGRGGAIEDSVNRPVNGRGSAPLGHPGLRPAK